MYHAFVKATQEILVYFTYSILLMIWVVLATISYCIAMTPEGGGF